MGDLTLRHHWQRVSTPLKLGTFCLYCVSPRVAIAEDHYVSFDIKNCFPLWHINISGVNKIVPFNSVTCGYTILVFFTLKTSTTTFQVLHHIVNYLKH